MIWNIPNILTVVRLLAAPALGLAFVLIARPAADWVALGLFVGASLTDWFDGYLARRWNQTSRFGAMLDPIADKAMVIIALALVIGLSGLNPWLLVPGTVILFREVFVSGLREFLGADAGRLKVTRLAKWKTTAQMVAITLLLLSLGLQDTHYHIYRSLEPAAYEAALRSGPDDWNRTWQIVQAGWLTGLAGATLFWIAAGLTAITGWDYFRKSLPFLSEDRT
jgi:CDP-diacylglycerol--glycerol-3-phosphate 3-phosphatidyltransferase